MNKHFAFILALLAFTLGFTNLNAQEKQAYKVGIVGFYNLENLFDTIDDPLKLDEEFLPQGGKGAPSAAVREPGRMETC